MKRFNFAIFLIYFLAETSFSNAAILFESGTLGTTGVRWQDAIDGLVPGSSVSNAVFNGVRFEVSQAVLVTEIGGHFFSPSGGSFFGAVVALDDEDDLPNSQDLSTQDVIDKALLGFPTDSAEVFGEFNHVLEPGWYALVFGSGLFEATGFGGMVLNNPDIGSPTYIARQIGPGWFNLSDVSDAFEFVDFRFVVLGNIIPEPASLGILLIGLLCFVLRQANPTRK